MLENNPKLKPKTIKPIRANAGIREQYYKTLMKNIRNMREDTQSQVINFFKAKPPALIEPDQKKSYSKEMAALLIFLAIKWEKIFKELSGQVPKDITKSVMQYTDRSISQKLKMISVPHNFKFTAKQRDVFNALVEENVSLIKSIPQKYFDDVKGSVMRAFSFGHDETELAKDLYAKYKITQRRANIIARDQIAKANAAFVRVRQEEMGVKYAYWRYTWRSKTPRPDHVRADGRRYEIKKGCLISGDYIQPAQLTNCKCVSEWELP